MVVYLLAYREVGLFTLLLLVPNHTEILAFFNLTSPLVGLANRSFDLTRDAFSL